VTITFYKYPATFAIRQRIASGDAFVDWACYQDYGGPKSETSDSGCRVLTHKDK